MQFVHTPVAGWSRLELDCPSTQCQQSAGSCTKLHLSMELGSLGDTSKVSMKGNRQSVHVFDKPRDGIWAHHKIAWAYKASL